MITKTIFISFLLFALCNSLLFAHSKCTTKKPRGVTRRAEPPPPPPPSDYKVNIVNKNSGLSEDLVRRFIEVFHQTYPRMAQDFNPQATKNVTFILDPAYEGVAFASGDSITFGAKYFLENPKDVDVVTHEGMHLVQAYPANNAGWLVEGIADFARDKYGVANADAGWSLPPYEPGQNYTDGYRVAAAFLKWADGRYGGPVLGLDKALRAGLYNEVTTWVQLTGRTVQQVWQEYVDASQ